MPINTAIIIPKRISTMKRLISILALTVLVACSTPASANDVADDGKCLDDIKHFNHLWKTTSASDEAKASAKAKRDEGSNHWAQGEKEKCETAYQAAWALID
jgi:uncharacterized lipoprotein YajG